MKHFEAGEAMVGRCLSISEPLVGCQAMVTGGALDWAVCLRRSKSLVSSGSTTSPRRSHGSARVVGGYRRHIRQQASCAIISTERRRRRRFVYPVIYSSSIRATNLPGSPTKCRGERLSHARPAEKRISPPGKKSPRAVESGFDSPASKSLSFHKGRARPKS